MQLEDLNKALENEEFIYYYQPKISMIKGELYGAEALLRWQKPDGRIVPPSEFIPLAESSGFINEITLSMFNKLIIDINIVHQVNDKLVISFNASAKDFFNNKLTEKIQKAVENKLIIPNNLEVELTETANLKEKSVRYYLERLKEMCIGIAMDDFGSGYSSIDTLSKWPFRSVKIDQELVSRMELSDKDHSIVTSSIRMVLELGLEIIAEGIETENAYNMLLDVGCSIGQGYWISQPLPLHSFIDFILSERNWPTSLSGMMYLAQLNHLKWRKAVIDGAIFLTRRKSGKKYIRGAPQLDPTECQLGKWYYSVQEKFSGNKWFDSLEKPHNQLHHVAEKLLETASGGGTNEEIMLLLREFSELSILVIRMLQNIEHQILSRYTSSY